MLHLRVLVVDDDDATLYTMRRGLTRADVPDVKLTVESASGGDVAIGLIEDLGSALHLVVSDYRMDAVDGGQVLAAAREHAPDAVRVLVSGFASDEVMEEARAHAHRFFEKPPDYTEFEGLMRRCVELAVARLQAAPE